ncbi:MAG: LamG-like jellyroll fold domain-containing protein [Planctomycetota bacterium]
MFTRKMIIGTVVVLLALMSAAALGDADWYVDPCGSDAGACNSWGTACETIEGAINKAANGDVIEVNEGTYTGHCEGDSLEDWHYAVDPNGKNITIRSTDPNDAAVVASTIISPFCPALGCGSGPFSGIRRSCSFTNAEDPNCRLSGFTILTFAESEGSSYTGEGAVMLCDGSSPTISKCVFTKEDPNDPNYCMNGIDCNNSGALITDCTLKDNDFPALTPWPQGKPGKAIWVRGSQSDVIIKDSHIVDNNVTGQYTRGVICHRSGDVNIMGCTITGNAGGPIHSEVWGGHGDANLTITDCNISGNTPRGVYAQLGDGGQITISACTIADNNGANGAGVQIDTNDADLVIEDCSITGNFGGSYGGGIYLDDFNKVTIEGCTITDNSTDHDSDYGGGIFLGLSASPVIISNCVISDNTAGTGGGIESWADDLTVENCTITGNKALSVPASGDFGGGGISSWTGLTLRNCEITGNKTLGYGGGIEFTNDGDSLIRNCTIADNFADSNGGGIYMHDDSCDVQIKNCILWGNQSDGGGDQVATDHKNRDPDISYSDGEGCGGSGSWQWDPNWDAGNNIDVDPWFVGPGYWFDVNRALSFDGSGDYVDVGDPNDDSLDFGANTDFSLSLWFKTSMSDAGFLVNKRAKGKTKGYDTYIQSGQIWARIGNTAKVIYAQTTETFNDDNWHHFVAVYDRDDVVTVYVDDVNEASSGSISTIGNIDNSQDFIIGDRKIDHAYFDGEMDDVRVYDKVLSVNDIGDLYQNGPTWSGGTDNLISRWEFDGDANDSAGSNDGTVYGATWTTGLVEPNAANATWHTGDYHLPHNSPCIDVGDPNDPNSTTDELDIDGDWRVMDGDGDGNDIVDMGSDEVGVCAAMISHWKFEEGNGITAADSVSDNNGTLYGEPNWVTGQVGTYALDFNGTSDYVDVGDQDDLDFGEEADFTVSAWFKTSSSSAQMIVNKRAKGQTDGYDVYVQSGNIFARLGDGTTTVTAQSSGQSFANGSWHHAVVVYDRSDKITVYVDKVVKAASTSISGLGDTDTTQVFTIGDRNDVGWHAYFNGEIDDVIVFDRCLTAEEVKHLYQYHADYCY